MVSNYIRSQITLPNWGRLCTPASYCHAQGAGRAAITLLPFLTFDLERNLDLYSMTSYLSLFLA